MSVEFRPMRSVIYVDVCREEYRHRLQHWLYGHHIQDSISNFGPYVTKYAFYNALPKPVWAQQERFPFLKSNFNIVGMFLTDIPTSDNLTQFRGYITMR